MKRSSMIAAGVVGALVMAASAGYAQTYPNKPVKMISAFAPGGGSDVALRIVAQKLVEAGWPSVVVENRTGGGGAVAAMVGKQAEPDGYTLLQADASSFGINVTLVPDLPYDPLKDFTPITLTWTFPSVLVVPASSPAKTAADLIALARSKPGGISYASQGLGSGGHLLGTMFQNALAVPMIHVPYRGAGQAMPDVAAGRVDYIFASLASIKPFIESKTVRMLAVTSKKRIPELPDVPTMTEVGQPSVFLDIWFGLVGPPNLSPAIVKTVNEKVRAVLHSSDVVKRLSDLGLYVETNSPDEFRELIRADIKRLGDVVRGANIKRE